MNNCVIHSRIDDSLSINVPNAKTRLTLEKANRGEEITSTSLEKLSSNWDDA